jgi:hypothetical protein
MLAVSMGYGKYILYPTNAAWDASLSTSKKPMFFARDRERKALQGALRLGSINQSSFPA